jgi:hypothetical protein
MQEKYEVMASNDEGHVQFSLKQAQTIYRLFFFFFQNNEGRMTCLPLP